MRDFNSPSYFTFYAILMALSLGLTSCGRNEEGEGASALSSKVIVGDLNWSDVQTLGANSEARANSKRVAYLDIPSEGARCTAFLIAPDVIITNQHCIPKRSDAEGVTASFNHVSDAPISEYKSYKCDEFIGNNQELDFALLRCSGRPGDLFGFVSLDESGSQSVGQKIYVIQQNCDYFTVSNCDPSKKIAYGNVLKLSNEYVHNADTLGGSSGSPVFDQQNNRVFALHHVGIGNDGNGRGSENHAVPMSKIVPAIKRFYPEVLAGSGLPSNQSIDFEPNDTARQAAQISSAQKFLAPFEIKARDLDYYKVNLTSDKHLYTSIGFWHSQGDLDLKVLDKNQNVVAISEGTANYETISLDLPAGEYLILVYGYKGAKAKYNFLTQY